MNLWRLNRFFFWKFPVNICLFKVEIRSTRKRCEICLKLTIKTPMTSLWSLYFSLWTYFTPFSSIFIVDLVQIFTRFILIPFIILRTYFWQRHVLSESASVGFGTFYSLTHSSPIFIFYTPWKCEKAKRFQGVYKWNIGLPIKRWLLIIMVMPSTTAHCLHLMVVKHLMPTIKTETGLICLKLTINTLERCHG